MGCVGLLMVAVACAASGQTITIASWNVENLGMHTDIQSRANVIAQFDLVALQEIDSQEGLNNLRIRVEAITAVDWDVVISPKIGQGNAAEYYAFIYRTDCVNYVQSSSAVYPERAPDEFSREPFCATFRSGSFDFTLITVHITWGSLASLRTAECRRLPAVWDWVQSRDAWENDLILLGDFNRDKPTHSAFDLLVDQGMTSILTQAGTKTTFGLTPTGGSWYDHIWINPQHTAFELADQFGVGTPSINSYGSGCAAALAGISDHCPVWAVFDTATDDDPPDM